MSYPIKNNSTFPPQTTQSSIRELRDKLSCILCNEKLNPNTCEHKCNVREADLADKTIILKRPRS